MDIGFLSITNRKKIFLFIWMYIQKIKLKNDEKNSRILKEILILEDKSAS